MNVRWILLRLTPLKMQIVFVRFYGLKLPVLESDRRAFLKTYYFEPALSIEGISTGYQGQGVKTILPAKPGFTYFWVYRGD